LAHTTTRHTAKPGLKQIDENREQSLAMTTGLKSTIAECPACGQASPEPFYRLSDIPVHSCLLQETAQAARNFPRAELELAVCHGCGFIANILFDGRWMAYATDYEDQQSYSPTFNRFARNLVSDLVGRHNLIGKDIIEIGCGKGDFLQLLCKAGGNRGVGIDPSVAPQRQANAPETDILWIPEYFGSQHSNHPADYIICRHTLEHISAVGRFTQTLREVIGERSVPVFLEVPETMRILEQCAFEDIYYAHCSYFTAGSLARLFWRCGFAIRRLYRGYDEQYLMLEAVASEQEPTEAPALAETTDETLAAVGNFCRGIESRFQFWQDELDRNQGRHLAIWGSGSKCVAFLSSLKPDLDSTCVVDINPHRQGKFIPGSGLEIKPPEFLRQFRPQKVIVMNRIYTREIGQMLEQMGVTAELSAL
jgi:SAM-dependent methyltransferase